MDNTVEELLVDEAPKLTDWENEPTVRDLKEDYNAARSEHDYYTAKIKRWLDNLYITGAAKVPKRAGRSSIVPKLIRKQAEWRYAALSEPFLSQEDIFTAKPRTWKDREPAYQNALILNYQFNNQIDKVKFIDEYVRTAVNEGTVIVRVGWEFKEEEKEVDVPVMGTEAVTDLEEIQALLEQGLPPVKEIQVSTRKEMKMVTVVNRPTVEICGYDDVIIDPTCGGDIDKAQFVIYGFDTSMAELEEEGIYKNLEYIDVERNSILAEPDDSSGSVSSFQFKDKPRKKIRAHEYWGYWDINNDGKVKPFVATWVGDTMIRMVEAPFPDEKIPFIIVQYLPRKNEIYGEPDGELLEDNQKVIGAITRGMIDIMGRSAAGQKGIRTDALDITNRRKYEAGDDYEFQAHIDPNQAFHDHVFPEIPTSAQFMLQLQQAEAESLTGVKAFHQGLSGEAYGDVARGVKGVLDASGKREIGILRRLAEGMKKIGYKIIAMNGQFLDDDEIVRISDEEFVEINRENLVGRFDLSLDISSAETDNLKAQELAFMLQTVGPNEDPGLRKIIMADIARLRKMPQLEKQIKEYEPKPDPLQQEIARLQVMKLQMEIEKLRSEADENRATGLLNMAKSQSEQAKARALGGQADKLDLDFLDQQTGRSHQREMEKQGAQADANIRLKEREAELKDRNVALSKAFDADIMRQRDERTARS